MVQSSQDSFTIIHIGGEKGQSWQGLISMFNPLLCIPIIPFIFCNFPVPHLSINCFLCFHDIHILINSFPNFGASGCVYLPYSRYTLLSASLPYLGALYFIAINASYSAFPTVRATEIPYISGDSISECPDVLRRETPNRPSLSLKNNLCIICLLLPL